MTGRKIVLTAALGLLFIFGKAQENYPKIFSSDYDKAIHYLKEEEKWMNDLILSYGLKPGEVKAVVFPELIRYNAIQDKIETFALESLYIQYGKDYANFSIGQFQIKPSFAENIEIDFLKTFSEQQTKIGALSLRDTIQSQANRSARLQRLKSREEMVNYVCLFFKVMESRYPKWNNTEEKVKFFASAYNSNYRKSKTEITSFISKKFFHAGLVGTEKYAYADIAWYYFQHQ